MEPKLPVPRIDTGLTTRTTKSFLSRTLTRLTPDSSPSDPYGTTSKGPLGLTTVYGAKLDEGVVADIVFVHGINGGSQSSWSKGNNPAHFWPKTWLPLDAAFHDVRIHSFGYPSAVGQESVLNITDFASALLAAVKDSPVMNQGGEQPPLIFVAHSMGGLVVKRAYVLGHQEPEYHAVVERIHSILFLGTPHQGAAIARTVSRIIAFTGARPFLDDLLPQSPMLQCINDDFPKVADKLQLLSFYETKPMSVGGVKALIVDKMSAVMNLPNERRILLNADHRGVAMFASPNDPTYLSVRNAMAAIVSLHRDAKLSNTQFLANEDQEALNKFLGIHDAPEDDLMTLDSLRVSGSCEWIDRKDYYQSWKQALDSSLVWLRGRPGAGKSVLAGYVVNEMRLQEMDCCFFFFQASDNTKSSLNSFLRSMAWQMTMLHPQVLAKVRELMPEWKDGAIDTVDPNPVWRKLFLSGILKARINRPQFWVLDGIDQCKNSHELMDFILRIQEHWPVAALITSRDPIESHLARAHPHIDISSHAITDDDNKADIALMLQSNMAHLPCQASENWPTPDSMAAQIVHSSGGCFLWASLVCSELHEVTSEKEIEEVLESIPSDMNALYSKILRDIGNARFGKELAKAFITWTTYAFRPLTTSEMQRPIEMDMDDRIDDVERAISKCCGHILYVDARKKVKLIHPTAREFLTRNETDSEFIVSKAEGHGRLAKVCLRFMIQGDRNRSRPSRLNSEPEPRQPQGPFLQVGDAHSLRRNTSEGQPPSISRLQRMPSATQLVSFDEQPFTDYASKYLFSHLNMVSSTDEEIIDLLFKFLGSNNVLNWIEYVASHGDLNTVYQAGKTIKSMLSRCSQHASSIGVARGQKKFNQVEKWGDDLIHLVTKFSKQLRSSPHSIHHLIPPFCPPDSAIRQQFSNPYRGLNVAGLSSRGWEDCLATITYGKGMKPNTIASGRGCFAVGMMNAKGNILVYDDSIFQETYNLSHGEPVWRLVCSDNGEFLASAGAKTVRIWSIAEGKELTNFGISSLCLAMQFAEEDTILRVAIRQNELIEFDILADDFLRDEPATWTADLEETMQSRVPTLIAIGHTNDLLSVSYRGENLVLWDCLDDRIHDVYEKETGSVAVNGSHKLAQGTTTVVAMVFSQAIDSNLLAAAYTDGDLVVYEVVSGEAIASTTGVNINLLSSSPDGRTLAGVDSGGNLTLFEFETLKRLYRVRLDTPIVPKGLTFTSDSRRFIEIRGQHCRVWEPSVLIRTDVKDEGNSDTLSVTSGTEDVDFSMSKDVKITALVCCKESSIVFYATTDGCVYACDTNGEPQTQQLFVQTHGCPIDIMFLDETSSVLGCSDLSGRVTARKVVRQQSSRQVSTWEVDEPLVVIESMAQHGDVVKSIILSEQQRRILITTEKIDTLRSISASGHGNALVVQADAISRTQWLAHSGNKQHLIRTSNKEFTIHNWSDLKMVYSVPIPGHCLFDRLAPLHHPSFFATVSGSHSTPLQRIRSVHHGVTRHAGIQIWNVDSLTPGGHTSTPQATPTLELDGPLASQIELLIGALGTRLIVYTTDHWIASLDIYAPEALGNQKEALVRHFFLPTDWVSTDHSKLLFGIGHQGEILFAKHSELAVIRRGLETTESGTNLNVRWSHNGQSRGSSMLRGRGISPVPSSDRLISIRGRSDSQR